MTEMNIYYEGDLRTRCVHQENQAQITTDAPKDNQGLGREFSPTDLLAASLGSCALTLMGIAARKWNVDIKGTQAVVSKEMQTAPVRRIAKITVAIHCPQRFSEEITQKLIDAVENCPVRHSLHADLKQEITYSWG